LTLIDYGMEAAPSGEPGTHLRWATVASYLRTMRIFASAGGSSLMVVDDGAQAAFGADQIHRRGTVHGVAGVGRYLLRIVLAGLDGRINLRGLTRLSDNTLVEELQVECELLRRAAFGIDADEQNLKLVRFGAQLGEAITPLKSVSVTARPYDRRG